MKKLLLILLILTISTFIAYAETLTLNTYYPAPFGSYDRLRLVPRAAVPACDLTLVGSLYYDETEDTLKVCGGTGIWANIKSAWTQIGDDVYLTDNANPNIAVGIGTLTPASPLHVVRDTIGVVATVQNTSTIGPSMAASFVADGIGGSSNTGIQAIGTGGTNNNTGIYAAGSGDGIGFQKGVRAFGLGSSGTIDTYGVEAVASGTGVANYGIHASATGASGNYGVYGSASSGDAADSVIGVYGSAAGVGLNTWSGYFDAGDVYMKNNVGIGVLNPTDKLMVLGNAAMSEGITTGTIRLGIYGPNPTCGVDAYIENGCAPGASARIGMNSADLWLLPFGVGAGVGIGTTVPQNMLDVKGGVVIGSNFAGIQTAEAEGLLVEGKVQIGAPYASIVPTRSNLKINQVNATDYPINIRHEVGGADLFLGTPGILKREGSLAIDSNEGDIYFRTNLTAGGGPETDLTTRVFIESGTGNVGIGTALPSARLNVEGGDVQVGCVNCDNEIRINQSILMGGTNKAGAERDFTINPVGLTDTVRILGGMTTTGDAGIGGPENFIPNYTLDVRGSIGSDAVLYHSDARWKRNIEPLVGSLDKLVKLRGISYEWNQEEAIGMNFSSGREIGLIAQEVEEIIPEVVDTDKDGYKSVDYPRLVAVLIEAVKELKSQNEELTERIKALEAK